MPFPLLVKRHQLGKGRSSRTDRTRTDTRPLSRSAQPFMLLVPYNALRNCTGPTRGAASYGLRLIKKGREKPYMAQGMEGKAGFEPASSRCACRCASRSTSCPDCRSFPAASSVAAITLRIVRLFYPATRSHVRGFDSAGLIPFGSLRRGWGAAITHGPEVGARRRDQTPGYSITGAAGIEPTFVGCTTSNYPCRGDEHSRAPSQSACKQTTQQHPSVA